MLEKDDILRRIHDNPGQHPVFTDQPIGDLDLRGQVLDVPLNLTRARVEGRVDISSATLNAGLFAGEARFNKPVIMNRCKVFGDIYAKGAQFADRIDMSWARCSGRIYFWRARFTKEANFFQLLCGPGGQTSLESYVHTGELNLSWAWFHGPVDFGRCHMNGPVYFWRTRFFDTCSFDEASFAEDATFMGAVSEISLARDELPDGIFDRLEQAGMLRPDQEEVMIMADDRRLSRFAQLSDVLSEQQLQDRLQAKNFSPAESDFLIQEYRKHGGPMFSNSALLTRLRIAKPRSVKFIGVNAKEWDLKGTDVDAIAFFNAAEEPVPVPVGLGHVYHSVFISYGGPDREAARRLNLALSQAGVETYFFPEDTVPGHRIETEMRDGVEAHDRTLLLCSTNSVGRPGWQFEAYHAFKLEENDKLTRLIPIALDQGLWGWQPGPEHENLKTQILNRAYADFTNCSDDHDAFNEALGQLLKGLIKSK